MYQNFIFLFLIVFIFYLVFRYEFNYTETIHKILYPHFYQNDEFVVDRINPSLVQKGKNNMKENTIVFCGLCRDSEDIVVKNILWMRKIGKGFKDYRIILFENDSQDRTRENIIELQKLDDRIELIDCEHLGSKNCKINEMKMYDLGALSKKRIEKMCFFRNQYLSHIKKRYSHFDYVMMMDMDVVGYFNKSGLNELFALQDKWDVVFVNGRSPVIGFYDMCYDSLALVFEDENYEKYIRKNEESFPILNLASKSFFSQIFGSKFVKVKSSFNGCGIYKMGCILGSQFYPNYSCEWIGFHRDIFENGFQRMFVARDWKLYAGRQGPRIA